MNQPILTQKKMKLSIFGYEKLIDILRREYLLIIATFLATVTSFISTPKINYIDFKMLITLFNLMVVVAGLREIKVLDFIAVSILSKCKTAKAVASTMIFITFISAMIMSNDVALFTFIPITLIVGKKVNIKVMKIVILQTIAANLGSSIMPMGNPHNIYLYNLYNINPIEFLEITLPIALFGIAFLTFLISREKNKILKFNLRNINITSKNNLICFSMLLIVILLSVFHIVDYRLAFVITLLVISILNRKLFMKVDYSLIITFVAFFIFIGNISNMEIVKEFMRSILNGAANTYFAGILSCQVISNVPTTILLSGFTDHYKELLLATNVGGLGTLIASMANTISYRIYTNEHKIQTLEYLKTFTIYNFSGLILFTIIMGILNMLKILPI